MYREISCSILRALGKIFSKESQCPTLAIPGFYPQGYIVLDISVKELIIVVVIFPRSETLLHSGVFLRRHIWADQGSSVCINIGPGKSCGFRIYAAIPPYKTGP
jgi:hypothetical protein